MENSALIKEKALNKRLCALKRVAVAFSGGVDSTYLLHAAVRALGSHEVLALTADSQLIPREDIERAKSLAALVGAQHLVLPIDALGNADIAANGSLRCYYCKTAVFSALQREARDRGFGVLLDGSNADDGSDYRPGKRATAELHVLSPLEEAGLTKRDIRALSAQAGLPTVNLPAYACLATRIQTGTPLDAQTLARIERAERSLHALGIAAVRVRSHGDVARIEAPQNDLQNLLSLRTDVVSAVRDAGFRYVSLDLEGYRMGSSNGDVSNG